MDNLTADQRSRAMRAVKSRDTSPELIVRELCRELGQTGYRLHRADIPGRPDLAYIGRRLAIFVHGCFWHGHDCQAGAKTPRTNAGYWQAKIARNQARDRRNLKLLEDLGWRTLVVWECETRLRAATSEKLARFFSDGDAMTPSMPAAGYEGPSGARGGVSGGGTG